MRGIIAQMSANKSALKQDVCRFVGSSQKDLRQLPPEVRGMFGQAVWEAQLGRTHPAAKVLHGFGGSGILELIEDRHGSAYRAVYTVKFAGFVFVLHVFQKKSKSGTKTPPRDIALIKARLKEAARQYVEHQEAIEESSGGRAD